MLYRRFNDKVVLRLDKGDDIVKSVAAVAEKENIRAASVSGIGATDNFTVGVFDTDKGEYNRFEYKGAYEINVLVGNLSVKDGNPYVHLHITCTGIDGKVVGGHLIDGAISLTGEIVIDIIDGAISRKYDDTLGINRWNF